MSDTKTKSKDIDPWKAYPPAEAAYYLGADLEVSRTGAGDDGLGCEQRTWEAVSGSWGKTSKHYLKEVVKEFGLNQWTANREL